MRVTAVQYRGSRPGLRTAWRFVLWRSYGTLALGDSLTSLMADHPHSRNVDLYM